MKTEVYFIRRSETFGRGNTIEIKNSDDSFLKNEKSMLSVSGEKKAEELSKNSELLGLDAVYSSNYVRCMSTAKYFAAENDTIIYVDERLNERVVGDLGSMEFHDFLKCQSKDFDYKLPEGESLNDTKKRIVEAVKDILFHETGNRIAVVSDATALTCLLSAWCTVGYNYDDDVILTYNDQTIVDGRYTAPMVFKVVFEDMNPISVEYMDI